MEKGWYIYFDSESELVYFDPKTSDGSHYGFWRGKWRNDLFFDIYIKDSTPADNILVKQTLLQEAKKRWFVKGAIYNSIKVPRLTCEDNTTVDEVTYLVDSDGGKLVTSEGVVYSKGEWATLTHTPKILQKFFNKTEQEQTLPHYKCSLSGFRELDRVIITNPGNTFATHSDAFEVFGIKKPSGSRGTGLPKEGETYVVLSTGIVNRSTKVVHIKEIQGSREYLLNIKGVKLERDKIKEDTLKQFPKTVAEAFPKGESLNLKKRKKQKRMVGVSTPPSI